ncbi:MULTISPECIES: hypothetical protein [unclassified Meiothermus]|nr:MULTISPECIES: hypothetical protein [unclassified Meiothermus]
MAQVDHAEVPGPWALPRASPQEPAGHPLEPPPPKAFSLARLLSA